MSVSMRMCGSAFPAEAVKLLAFEEDEDTTDAGSDRETVCASTQASDSEDCQPRPTLLATGASRRRAAAPRFRSVLASIPGTPSGGKAPVSRPPGTWAAAPRPAASARADEALSLSFGPPDAQGTARPTSRPAAPACKTPAVLSTAAPSQPRQAPRKAPVLSTAAPSQPLDAPQKVSLPAEAKAAQAAQRPLDPSAPAKKKPIAGLEAGGSGLDKAAPLKKRVTSFLVQEPQFVVAM